MSNMWIYVISHVCVANTFMLDTTHKLFSQIHPYVLLVDTPDYYHFIPLLVTLSKLGRGVGGQWKAKPTGFINFFSHFSTDQDKILTYFWWSAGDLIKIIR